MFTYSSLVHSLLPEHSDVCLLGLQYGLRNASLINALYSLATINKHFVY